MKHDYTKLDAAIIDQIEAGNTMFDGIVSKCQSLATPFRKVDAWGNLHPEYRVIADRLQALRRSGKIAYSGRRWHICNHDGSVQQ